MAKFSINNSVEVESFVSGCTFYGTGGGGSPEYGRDMMNRVLKEGKVIQISDVSEVKDNAWTCSVFGMGSIAPRTQKVFDEMKEMGLTKPVVQYKLHEAIKELEKYTNKKVSVIAPIEIGGANTPDPVATACHAGLMVVDGDYSGGRAIPEAIQTMPHFKGNPMCPLASVDEWGNSVFLDKAVNNKSAEKIGKLVAVLAYGNLAGQASWLFRGSDMKRLLTPGTLSRAFAAGKKIGELREKDVDLKDFAKSVGGHYVFKGTVASKDEENRDAEYYWGSYTVEGEDDFKGHTFKVWFKNENHMSWLDGKMHVMSPDSINALDVKNMNSITNPKIAKGDKLAIFVFRSIKSFRTRTAIECLGPRHFGFDTEFVPMEKLVKPL